MGNKTANPSVQLIHVRPEVDAPIITIAETQDEFVTVEGALVRSPGFEAVEHDGKPWNTVLYAMELSDEQREGIARGEHLYVSLLTFGGGPQGIMAFVGKQTAASVFNVKAL